MCVRVGVGVGVCVCMRVFVCVYVCLCVFVVQPVQAFIEQWKHEVRVGTLR